MKIIKIFILLFFFLNVNNSQLTPITPETTLSASVINTINDSNVFFKTPRATADTYCDKSSYDIHIKTLSGSIVNATTNGVGFNIIKKSQTNNEYLYSLYSGLYPSFGTSYQDLTFTTNDNINHTYKFIITCSDFNIDNLVVSTAVKPFYIMGTYYYYISIYGIEPISPFQISTTDYTYIKISNDPIYNYVIQISSSIVQNLTKDIDITLKFSNNRLFPIKVESFFAQFNEEDLATTHIDTFYPPNILSPGLNFTEFAYQCGPVLQSMVNTNIIRPYQLIYARSVGEKFTIPIKGKKGNMTYIGMIANGNTTFINADGLSIINFNISTNIQAITLPSVMPIFISSATVPINPIPIYAVIINNTQPFQFTNFFYNYFSDIIRGWPYGFHSGNNKNYTHKVSFVQLGKYSTTSQYSFGINISAKELSKTFSPLIMVDSPSPPKLLSYEFTRVSNQKYLLRLMIESVNGIKNIIATSSIYIYIDSLVSGTIYNGTFEFITGYYDINHVIINDLYGYTTTYKIGDVISLDPLVIFQLPSEINYKLNISNFQNNNIRFLKNNLNLEEDSYNIIYVESSDIPQDKPMSFVVLDPISFPIERDMSDINSKIFRNPFIYNTSTGVFECKFILPKNNIFGNIQYMIEYAPEMGLYSSDLLTQLFVNNTVLDNQGPLFSSFEKIGNGLVISSTTPTGTIGWKFNITDDLNGFESGYIKVMGTVDSSTYHFNFTMNDVIGDKFNCQYQILINITQPCITQEYRIVRVILFDTNKIVSKFNLYTPSLVTASIVNPFLNFLDQGIDITILPFVCSTLQVTNDIKPTLLSFTTSTTTMDVGATNRTITFDFSIDNASTIKLDQLPTVYITSLFNGLVECISKLVSNDSVNVFYSCSTELPLGFGFPNSLAFSLYGIVNNGGYYYGYSSDDIYDVPNSNYYINTTFTNNQPVIKSTDRYYSDDNGELVIYGRGLSKVSRVDFIYSDSTLSPNSATSTTIYGSSVIRVGGIKNTKNAFYIKAQTSEGLISNEYTVYPIYFNSTATPKPTPSPTTTPIPTITPIPTNPPQKCLGNPECGGKNQGYCSPTGCICYSPWIGTTCTSQIIIVPQPSTNTTNPQVEIPTDNNNGQSSESNSQEPQKMIFKSLISLVSLRELNFKNEEVKNHIFDQWIYTPIDEFKNQYFTTVSNTNITATLEWFNQSTSIQFANQNLTMNPSSIKYTIEITKYQFSSSLNQLQLVMAASLTTNSNDICSLNQFGNTSTGDDSNYLKIQIENHSLYGRFIKRAIIDNIVKSISNVLLDSSLNVVDSSSSLQSFIGITIPYYSDSIIVDPDFSVLIDSKSASNEDDSVCTKKNSGLTTAQLAGIIVGSIAFAAVIVIGAVYIIVKRNKQKKFVENVNKKMTEMNNNK
ncbi:hypothetical protein ACTFIU_002522 [Dictyostelium citrinum]